MCTHICVYSSVVDYFLSSLKTHFHWVAGYSASVPNCLNWLQAGVWHQSIRSQMPDLLPKINSCVGGLSKTFTTDIWLVPSLLAISSACFLLPLLHPILCLLESSPKVNLLRGVSDAAVISLTSTSLNS